MVKTISLFDMTGVECMLFDALDIDCQYSSRFLLGRESIFSGASNSAKAKDSLFIRHFIVDGYS